MGVCLVKKRVLVVDAGKSSGSLELLLQSRGYDVLEASNGLQALKKAREESPHLVILDTFLPGLDGFEVCHRLRLAPETAHVPVLITSSRTQAEDRTTALRVGADAYMSKPLKDSDLMNQVVSLLGQKDVPEHGEVRLPRAEEELMLDDSRMERVRKPRKSGVDFGGDI